MKIYKVISLLVLSALLNSCSLFRKHKPFEGFEYCYTGAKLPESNLIDFASFYKMDYYSLNDSSVSHSRIFTFLDDGIYISSPSEDFIQQVSK